MHTEISCGPPTELTHGSEKLVSGVTDLSNCAGSRKVYECDLGFEFEEDMIDQLIECHSNGSWSELGECQRT